MDKLKKLYEGKAKIIYSTTDINKIIIYYKDCATAFDGVKMADIKNKGIYNNKISEILFKKIEKFVPTHYLKTLNKREQLCKAVKIFPISVIVRNIITGSITKSLDIEEGVTPSNVIYELYYRNNKLSNPLINDHHAVALNLCNYQELDIIYQYTEKINNYLKTLFDEVNIKLVDLKLEFGKTENGEIILADEISPDTCRLWDKTTNEKLDKDRFRYDMGNIIEAYQNILERLDSYDKK